MTTIRAICGFSGSLPMDTLMTIEAAKRVREIGARRGASARSAAQPDSWSPGAPGRKRRAPRAFGPGVARDRHTSRERGGSRTVEAPRRVRGPRHLAHLGD